MQGDAGTATHILGADRRKATYTETYVDNANRRIQVIEKRQWKCHVLQMRVFRFLLDILRLFGMLKAVERLSHSSIATPRFLDRAP